MRGASVHAIIVFTLCLCWANANNQSVNLQSLQTVLVASLYVTSSLILVEWWCSEWTVRLAIRPPTVGRCCAATFGKKKSITLPRSRTLWSVLLYRCGATSRRDSSTYGHRVQSRRTSRVVVRPVVVRPESSYVQSCRTSRVVVGPESSYVKSRRTSRVVVRQESSYVQSRQESLYVKSRRTSRVVVRLESSYVQSRRTSRVVVRQVQTGNSATMRTTLRELRQMQISRFFVHLSFRDTALFLKAVISTPC